jgi:hypothetical protein
VIIVLGVVLVICLIAWQHGALMAVAPFFGGLLAIGWGFTELRQGFNDGWIFLVIGAVIWAGGSLTRNVEKKRGGRAVGGQLNSWHLWAIARPLT